MSRWQEKKSVKKGNLGEDIILKWLEEKGWICYSVTSDRPHAFDFLAVKNKKEIMIVEVKAKAKLNNFPETGIEIKHYNEYKEILEKYNIPVFIIFVDEMLKEIYGNTLEELDNDSRESPWGNQILFKMKNMIHIGNLTDEQAEELRKLSERSYGYKL